MKITLEQYDRVYTVDLGHDDVTSPQAVLAFLNLLIASGYSSEQLKDLFAEGSDPWGWDIV